jgi:peptidoglycan/LPS O-acetylase OafA/YrhL
MGAIAYFAGQREHSQAWLWLTILLAITAITIDFRLRILIALCVALALFTTRNVQIKTYIKQQKLINYLGSISYSLFLVHFSVLMLTNTIFGWLNMTNPGMGCIFMIFTWAASLSLADYFHRKIEKPITSFLKLRFKQN